MFEQEKEVPFIVRVSKTDTQICPVIKGKLWKNVSYLISVSINREKIST